MNQKILLILKNVKNVTGLSLVHLPSTYFWKILLEK